MDYSSLPNIVALLLLILIYRPLMRRSGRHVNLWFFGWSFILLNSLNRFFAGPASLTPQGVRFAIASITLECGGLAFLMGSANRHRWLVDRGFITSLAAGPLVQALLFLLTPQAAHMAFAVSGVLYLLPMLYIASRRPWSNRPAAMVAAAYSIFGVVSFAALAHPVAIRAWAIFLIFSSAAYLSLRTSLRFDRANVTTALGLLGWGIKYPVLLALQSTHGQIVINRGLLQIPEYFVLAGSVLAMMEERLNKAEQLATLDPLTNLPNRRFLHDRFTEALAEARESKTTIACLVIDVDNFKHVNDTYGHAAGDAMLRALAVRLAWHISSRDVLARTGSDGFTAMLAGVSNEHYLRFVAEAMMSAASVPVQVEGEPIEVRISMGISLSPDDADEIDDMIRLADEAMYRAKRKGGNLLAFASDSDEPMQAPARPRATGQILQMAARGRTAVNGSSPASHVIAPKG